MFLNRKQINLITQTGSGKRIFQVVRRRRAALHYMEDPRGRRVLPYNRLHFSQQVFSLHDCNHDEDSHLKQKMLKLFFCMFTAFVTLNLY